MLTSDQVESFFSEKIDSIKCKNLTEATAYFDAMRDAYLYKVKEYMGELTSISLKLRKYEELLSKKYENKLLRKYLTTSSSLRKASLAEDQENNTPTEQFPEKNALKTAPNEKQRLEIKPSSKSGQENPQSKEITEYFLNNNPNKAFKQKAQENMLTSPTQNYETHEIEAKMSKKTTSTPQYRGFHALRNANMV